MAAISTKSGEKTFSEAEQAVDNGTYRTLPDEDLREMAKACLNVTGLNQVNVDRIRRKGEIIREELARREKTRQEQQRAVVLSAAELTTPQSQIEQIPNPWDEARLLRLISDQIEESLTIEYKSAAALSRDTRKMSDVSKDVSAMANSAGGILIYGIAQDPTKEHLPERIDPISRTDFSKEWLEQLTAQVQPRIPELRIYPVQLSSNSNHVAYVVEIPQGTTAYQAKDSRYYRRYNFESVPMQDHEVKDVMNRKTLPHVRLDAKMVFYKRPTREDEDGALIVTVINESDVFVRYVGLVVHSPIRIRGQLIAYKEATLDNGDDGYAYRVSFSNHNSSPLFPRGTLKRIFPFSWISRLNPEPEKQLSHLRWVVFADSMRMQSGSYSVDEIAPAT